MNTTPECTCVNHSARLADPDCPRHGGGIHTPGCTCPDPQRVADAACSQHGHDAVAGATLPATRHVPIRASVGFGPDNVPLSEAPTVALAFALGAAVSTPQRADRFGPFCAMVEELARRRVPGIEAMAAQSIMGSWDTSTELGALLAVLPARMAVELNTLYTMMRGQRWAATGRREGPGTR